MEKYENYPLSMLYFKLLQANIQLALIEIEHDAYENAVNDLYRAYALLLTINQFDMKYGPNPVYQSVMVV